MCWRSSAAASAGWCSAGCAWTAGAGAGASCAGVAMGRGNWTPGGYDSLPGGCLVYVDACAVHECGADGCWCVRHLVRDVRDTVCAWSGSWDRCRSRVWYSGGASGGCWVDGCGCDAQWRAEHGRGDRVVADSRLLRVVIDPGADGWHVGVAVCPAPSLGRLVGLADPARAARRLWSALSALGYPLSVRTSAWTSSAVSY